MSVSRKEASTSASSSPPGKSHSSICASQATSRVWTRYGCHCGSVRRWPRPSTLSSLLSLLLLLVSVETLSLATVTTATRMHYIHWNTTNPM